jgi:hypothetical protein
MIWLIFPRSIKGAWKLNRMMGRYWQHQGILDIIQYQKMTTNMTNTSVIIFVWMDSADGRSSISSPLLHHPPRHHCGCRSPLPESSPGFGECLHTSFASLKWFIPSPRRLRKRHKMNAGVLSPQRFLRRTIDPVCTVAHRTGIMSMRKSGNR